MSLTLFSPLLGDVALTPVWPHAGVPSNGTSGTLAGFAQPSDLLSDTTNSVLYQNTGTSASPTWSKVSAETSGSVAITGGTIDGTIIGGTTPAAATATSLTATGAVALSPANHNVVLSPTGTGVVTINPATAGTVNNVVIGGVTPLAITGTAVVGTTFNGNTFTTGTGTLTIAAGKTLTASNTLTFTGTDGSSVAVGAGGTLLPTGGAVSATTGLIPTRVPLTQMLTATGVPMTASPSSTNFGQTITLGTSAYLTGTATSSGSTANNAIIDIVLPPNYIAGQNITLTVEGYYTNGSSTASVHTCTALAYLNAMAGTQGATIIATGAQTITITTATAMTFTITGTTLTPGCQLTLEITVNMTNGGGASTAFITGISYT